MTSRHDHWANRTIQFLQPLLRQAERRVRIATGYFTIQGYDLLRDPLAEKQVFLMVGYDDPGKERLRERLIDEIMF
ncbi:MAG: hypothetical protein KDE28_11115, partial [Anaerolineales bacterium]|nr:hypothetical protein [Anaerolineales bacterium]